MTDRTFRFGELFCGPGGMAKGAHDAAASTGVDLVHKWANDYDRDTCATYLLNMERYGATTETVIHGNVRELEIEALEGIDGFAFGFPCNDFSSVGEWRGLDGEYGPLYSFGVRVLEAHEPEWFVAENVSGLQSANEGRAFTQILGELAAAGEHGYDLYPHLYSFDEYGVPQRRRRIMIVGIRGDQQYEFRVPAPSIYEGIPVSARHALMEPPMHRGMLNHEYTRQSDRVVERLNYIRPGENAFNAVDLPERLKLNVRGATISQIYKRLHPDQPAYTVTGSGGGGTHMYHWNESRALTSREKARLQTFPDDYEFIGSRDSVRKQVGMAVPVRGAEAVFTALFKSIRGEAYPSVAPSLGHVAARPRRDDRGDQ
ncbi:DNA cytosine methyltransferase [Homoserinibacter sp. YIM 151385]|uniref:DNA cytosine methyltransferase n=1 Tax=Homoserinibacter sp. YIM 151385 TaxID=2985506 RepID=UPI0022F0D2C1|nr:DNA (cytosine-5-)-methyltransferase [Homoserinibacter sp. YIM 151385]WBU38027.1 DNA (cytosine-5-)-methyltransferase [Homoserinibacter sp. YIM 151385]